MKSAVIYARNAGHNEQAINAQLAICRSYAVSHGFFVVAEFSDNGYSGMNLNRPGFSAMNERSNEWDTLIVSDMSRLSRNISDIQKYEKLLQDDGKDIVLATEASSGTMTELINLLQRRTVNG